MKILFNSDFEEFAFGRWADYLEANIGVFNTLDVFEFVSKYEEKLKELYRLSKVNQEKSKLDFQFWVSNIHKTKTIH